MYNKKYRLDKIEEFNGHNEVYDGAEGSLCYLAYLNPGERGWFLMDNTDSFFYEMPHRIHTSTIKDVEYVDNKVVVSTRNTRFTFVEISR